MKILIATTKNDLSAYRFNEAAMNKGLFVDTVLYEEIIDFPEPDFFKKFDFCILRDPYNLGDDYSHHLSRIKNFFDEKTLLDFNTLDKFPDYEDKLFQNTFFSKHKINMAKFSNLKNVKGLNKLKFPLIVKKRISSRGRHVFLVDSLSLAQNFFQNHSIKDYLFEEYIPLEKDYRIVVLDGKIIGSVSRKINIHKGEVKRMGVKVEDKKILPEKINRFALKIFKLFQCDFAGIDIFMGKDKKIYFGECNLSPQFASFEKKLEVDVAGLLMDFIKKKVS